MARHTLKAYIAQVARLVNKGFARITAESIITYDEAKEISGLDLVYWDFIKDRFPESGTYERVTVSGDMPPAAAGNEGDIHFRNTEEGTEIYQKVTPDTWELKGSISGGGSTDKVSIISSDAVLAIDWDSVPAGFTSSYRAMFGDFGNIEVYQDPSDSGNYKKQFLSIGCTLNAELKTANYSIPLESFKSLIIIS